MGELTFASLGVALIPQVVTCVVVLFIFNWLRNWASTYQFYNAKCLLNVPFRYRPKALSKSFLWWTALFKMDEDTILACAGSDALTYIRFLSLGLRMSIAIGFVCLVTVLPTNWIAGDAIKCSGSPEKCIIPSSDPEIEATKVSTLDKCSLGNIPAKSDWLWVHVGLVYVVSYIVMKMLWNAQREAVALRIKYLASTKKGGESHTVLVQNVPGITAGTLIGRVYDNMDGFIGKFIPGSIKAQAKALVEGGASGVAGGVSAVAGKTPLSTLSSKATPESCSVYLTALPSNPTQGGTTNNPRPSEFGTGNDAKALLQADASTVPISQRFIDVETREPYVARTDFDTWAQAEAAIQAGVSVEELVRREFTRTYPAQDVEAVTIVKNLKPIVNLVATYDKTKMQLEDLIDSWAMNAKAGKPIKTVMVKTNPLSLGAVTGSAEKLEKSVFLENQLKDLYDQIMKAIPSANAQDTCTAFVTMRKRLTQVQAASSLHYHNETYWTVEPASGPQEVIWSNIGYRGWERQIRYVLAWAVFVVFTIFFTIPVVALQGLMNLETLESLPGMNFILDNTVLRGLIGGLLPGLAMKIFLALVPMFLGMMNMLQGIYSKATNDFEVGRKYFIFQFLQVFVVSILGSSIIGEADKILDDFPKFVEGLGVTVPSSAQFYISYMFVSALVTRPISILRIGGVVVYLIMSKFIAGSDRAKRRLWANQYTNYGSDVPNHTLALLFLMVFSVMQPWICIPIIIYFMITIVVARYQFIYVFREAYQSGGRFQPILFDQMFVALVTFQLTMMGVLSVKQFPYSPLLIIPVVISFIFKSSASSQFDRPLANLSAHAAADLDRADLTAPMVTPAEEAEMIEHMDCEDSALGPVEQLYVAPAFKVSEADYATVLTEVAEARRRLEAYQQGGPVAPPAEPSQV